jgi:NAD(P)H-nitrite reductase large subunit
MSKSHITDLIIGAGAAGVGCAETLRRFDAQRKIAIVAPESGPPYSRPMLYYALAKRIPLENIRFRKDGFYRDLNIDFIQGRVVKIDPFKREVVLDDGRGIVFENLVIAAGGVPKLPKIPGVGLPGVFGFRTLEDLTAITTYAEKSRQAVILGGGNIGLQTAEGLHRRGIECSIVVKSPYLLSQLADEATGRLFEAKFIDNNIDIILNKDCNKIVGIKKVEAVKLDDGSEILSDMVIVGKGVAPDLSFVQGSSIETHWGIVVDDYMMSSVAGIYSAGDVAEVNDRLTGEKTTVGIWPAAFEQGQYVAYNILGQKRSYPGAVRMNSSEFFGLHLISIGVVNPKSVDFEFIVRQRGDCYRKLVFKGNKLWGAILVGEVESAGVLNSLIKSQASISDIRGELLDEDFDFSKLIAKNIGDFKSRF